MPNSIKSKLDGEREMDDLFVPAGSVADDPASNCTVNLKAARSAENGFYYFLN
ncbi:hypothetical protein FHS11_003186 [Mucilaginibacter gotjawali]|uniref:Uncharacterized protein n=1 Tax=Mucilaginibacter gotjawali TaxID=1550579 RepID=A0A839SIR2_9SPHI|nr:hypothetical protein [Mucilaginibacter gotjawali]